MSWVNRVTPWGWLPRTQFWSLANVVRQENEVTDINVGRDSINVEECGDELLK